MGKIERYEGRCHSCHKQTEVRQIDLYTIGSEGTTLCHSCEMEVVNFVRDMTLHNGTARRDLFVLQRKVLHQPLSQEQLREANGRVTAIVQVDLEESIIDPDREGFLDALSEKVTGDVLLSHIEYKIVGHEGEGTLYIEVTGNPELCVEADA